MWRATWKGLLAHKVRMALTALAVVLGVGFVAGTFVLTDTMQRVFDDLVGETSAGVDVHVRAETAHVVDPTPGSSGRDNVPETLLATVVAVDGVAVAAGSVESYAQIVTPDGEPVTTQGAPTLGFSWTPEPLNPLVLREGSAPAGPGEVVIDARTAADNDLGIGDEITVLTVTGNHETTVVGVAGFGEADNLAGATIAVFETDVARELFGLEGVYSSIEVSAVEGVAADELRDRIADVLPSGVEARTGTDVVAEMSAAIGEALGFFSTALLVFGAVGLFVGAFIIANTFTIMVAQRTREFALLRAIGASNRQVVGAVLAEALIVGLVASGIGIGFGLLLASGLRALLDAFGMGLPGGGLVLLPRTIVIALVLGTVITVGSALLPARRAARTAPVAAMRTVSAPVQPSARGRTVAGVLLIVVAAGLLTAGVGGAGGDAALLVGLSALAGFTGVAFLAPLTVRPLARMIGGPAARFGVAGQLARGNAARSPRRTAATAAALMIGLGLVAFVAVLSASLKDSFERIIDEEVRADFVIATQNPQFAGFSPAVADALRDRSEIDLVSEFRFGTARHDDRTVFISAIEPATFPATVKFDVVEGDLADLDRGSVFIDARGAEQRGLSVGDTYAVEFARTGPRDLAIVGIYENGGIMDGGPVISLAAHEEHFVERMNAYAFLTIAAGVGAESARAAVDEAITPFPNVTARDQTEFKEETAGQIDQILGLVTALLGMAILIAVLGITNTLALSVFERTREIGLLRAVGMSRRQVRSMVRWEAVIVSIIGALLGLGVGIVFGWAIVRALEDQGITHLVIPGGQLLGYVVAAGIAGVIAAVFPARRAARLDVLEAITFE